MPRIKGTLADVNVKDVPPAPATYIFKIEDCELVEDQQTGAQRVDIRQTIQDAGDENGKAVFTTLFLQKKDGADNKFGKRDLKRYAVAIVGEERANASDFDTDELLNQMFVAEVFHETYASKKRKNPDGSPAEEIAARIDTRTIQAA